MAEEQVMGYGYETDEVKQSPFKFGGNFANCFLTKCEYNPNGGKDGAEGECLDIEFTINGTVKGWRRFPFTQAYDKNNQPITDRKSQEFRDGFKAWNAVLTHVLHAFYPDDELKAKMSVPTPDFKTFAQLVQRILPADFKTKPLDIFLQYQYTLKGSAKRTYLDIPTNMKHGAWLKPSRGSDWEEVRAEDPSDDLRDALYYKRKGTGITKEDGTVIPEERHPFVRTGWFVKSNFAKQQRAEGSDDENETTAPLPETPLATPQAPLPLATPGAAPATPSSW